MKPGQLVMLIGSDGYMPPFGAIGTIVSGPDAYGEYDVDFPSHPCPVPPDTTWVAHGTWLMPINPGGAKASTETSKELEAA